MAQLVLPAPTVAVSATKLKPFGAAWKAHGGALSRTPPHSSGQLGELFDHALAEALASLLGGIAIVTQKTKSLIPPSADCIEVGSPKIIGGVRPQNFDVCYRPDGVRIAHDTKTLNDKKSIGKNWQNMVNDLATEATTVHSRFPHALSPFIVVLPRDALAQSQQAAIIETLERLARRQSVGDPPYMAEAMAFVVWNPEDGSIHPDIPDQTSPIRLEKLSRTIEAHYVTRYKGLPPHAAE
jgi:hypothetical protein